MNARLSARNLSASGGARSAWVPVQPEQPTIADAVEYHGLKVFIWDAGPNLRDRVLAAPHGASIWKGLLSIATRPMIEVFPSNQAETEEYRRIRETLFG
jgi:hypothetical protein